MKTLFDDVLHDIDFLRWRASTEYKEFLLEQEQLATGYHVKDKYRKKWTTQLKVDLERLRRWQNKLQVRIQNDY